MKDQMNSFVVNLKGEPHSIQTANQLASLLKLGDIVIFDGDLGTGKTFFIQALTKVLGSTDRVTSPTFTIANFYRLDEGQIIHIDAYRLSGLLEYRDLGLEEFLTSSIFLVEWGSRIAEDFDEYLHIKLDFSGADDTHRKIEFSYTGERWKSDFEKFSQKLDPLKQ